MRMRIVVSWAPYPEGSVRAQAQDQALERLQDLAPDWCALVYASLPGERPLAPLVFNDPSNIPLVGNIHARLLRDGRLVTEGHSVPYLRDMLDVAFEDAQEDDWGGVLNSDILVTPAFFEAMGEAHRTSQEALIAHRTDVPTADTPGDQGQKVNRRRCCDGFFTTRGVWDRIGSSIPDFVLGYPYWDTGMIWWCKMQRLKTVRLVEHEILHVNHGGRWNYKDAGTKYNGKLNRWMVKELLGIRGKDKTRGG